MVGLAARIKFPNVPSLYGTLVIHQTSAHHIYGYKRSRSPLIFITLSLDHVRERDTSLSPIRRTQMCHAE
jgi:hypothetical protein